MGCIAKKCLLAVLLAALLAVSAMMTFAAARVPCSRVISEVNRSISKGPLLVPDISEIAERLGTTKIWVERCMRIYGRRPERPHRESHETREAELERMEADEPEEVFREDKGEPKVEAKRPEKRRLRLPPTPTPHAQFGL
jgi:hypothetical protein